MGQANQARTQEWQLSTGLHIHLNSGPQELCNNRAEIMRDNFRFMKIETAAAMAANDQVIFRWDNLVCPVFESDHR